MATNTSSYELYFTDRDRSFSIAPYTTDGPRDPLTQSTNSKSVSINTSLLLFGKGMPDYGERTANNFINILENFSNDNETVAPTSGQLWYDTSVNIMKVFNAQQNLIKNVTIDSGNPSNSTITVDGNLFNRITALSSRGIKVTLMSDSTTSPIYQSYFIGGVTYNSSNDTTLINLNTPNLTIDVLNWTLGGWDEFRQNNVPLPPDDIFLFDTYGIYDPIDPISGNMVGNMDFNDSRYLRLDTSNITDPFDVRNVNISSVKDPILAQDAATKRYVDLSRFVKISGNVGDPMTNRLVLVGNPIDGNDAATKNYVDNLVGGLGPGGSDSLAGLNDVTITSRQPSDILFFDSSTSRWINKASSNIGFVQRTGDTMTGVLNVNPPQFDTNAANKKYVDDVAFDITGGTLSVVTSGVYDATAGNLRLIRSDGSSLDVPGFSTGGGSTNTVKIIHSNRPDYSSIPTDFIEEQFYESNLYSEMPLNNVLQKMSQLLSMVTSNNTREVITADGFAAIYTLSADIYVPGYNILQVYVDGLKQIADTRGIADIADSSGTIGSPPTGNDSPFTVTAPTGLKSGTTYSMDIEFDGSGAPIIFTIDGADALTFGDLVNVLNNSTGSPINGIAGSGIARLGNGRMQIISDTTGNIPGNISSVVITDSNLISNLTGDDISGAATWNISIQYVVGDVVIAVDNIEYVCLVDNIGSEPSTTAIFWRKAFVYIPRVESVTGITYDYSELGSVGIESQSIEFTTIPPTNALIEMIVINVEKTFV